MGLITKLSIESHVNLLEEYSKAYYEGNTLVSDSEYDALEEELRQLDPNNPWFNKVRESSASFYGIKRKHLYGFVGSIKKIHSLDESKLKSYTISAKLDGTSMTVYFKDGKVLYALTRGDGIEGFDVTDKYNAIIKKYNIRIPEGFTGGIRGEVVLTNSGWETFKKKHPEAKMQRNTGTGLMNSKEVTEETELLDWVIYEILSMNSYAMGLRSELSLLRTLNLGYPIVPYIHSSESKIQEQELKKIRDCWAQDYPLDGLVFNQINSWQRIEKSYEKLYYPISEKEAYKFEAESKETTVTGIEWTLQKSGRLIPVVQMAPVELSGAVVRRATANNADFILQKGIKPGKRIRVQRSNEVIPHIMGEELSDTFDGDVPENCPHCGSILIKDGVHLRCINPNCKEKQRLLTRHFLSVCGGQKIKGVGDSIYDLVQKETLEETLQYLQSGLFLGVTSHQQCLINKICDNILNGVDIENLINSVNPDGVGEKAIKRLCKLDNQEWLKDYVCGQTLYDSPKGLGNAAIESLMECREQVETLWNTLAFLMIPVLWNIEDEKPKKEGTRYFCVTGILSVSRGAFVKMCESKGWELASVKKAEVLVTNDPNSGSGKNKEAQALGKKVISENDFIEQYLK